MNCLKYRRSDMKKNLSDKFRELCLLLLYRHRIDTLLIILLIILFITALTMTPNGVIK